MENINTRSGPLRPVFSKKHTHTVPQRFQAFSSAVLLRQLYTGVVRTKPSLACTPVSCQKRTRMRVLNALIVASAAAAVAPAKEAAALAPQPQIEVTATQSVAEQESGKTAKPLGAEVPFCLSENVNQLINDFGEFAYNYTFVTGGEVLSAAGTPIEVSHTLFGLKNKWGAALVLVLILLVSILITFFGQMLERAALIITTGLVIFLVSHVWLTTLCRGGALGPTTAFVPCTLPFVLAILLALIAASLILWLTGRFPVMSPLMFGMAAGAIGAFLVRQVIVASVPSVVQMWVFDYYWLMAAVAIRSSHHACTPHCTRALFSLWTAALCVRYRWWRRGRRGVGRGRVGGSDVDACDSRQADRGGAESM